MKDKKITFNAYLIEKSFVNLFYFRKLLIFEFIFNFL